MFDRLKLGLDLFKLSSRWEAAVEKGWNPLISIRKALSALGLFIAGAAIMAIDEPTLAAIVGDAFPKEVAGVLTAVLVFGLRFAQNAWKARAAVEAAKAAGAVVLALLLLPGTAYAQAPAPTPSKAVAASMEADTSGVLVLDLSGWTLAVITRGEKREYVGGRVTLDAPIAGKLRAFARADVTGTQDFGSVESFAQYQTFRSVEGFVGARYVIHPAGLSVGALVGTSWSIEGDDGPLDPRMASALAVVRLPLPGDGYGYIGGGHRGPVGGAALVASVTYPLGPTRWIADYDYPLTKAEDGSLRPWVLKTGVAVPIKRWSLR
jgi:hypothetical protein